MFLCGDSENTHAELAHLEGADSSSEMLAPLAAAAAATSSRSQFRSWLRLGSLYTGIMLGFGFVVAWLTREATKLELSGVPLLATERELSGVRCPRHRGLYDLYDVGLKVAEYVDLTHAFAPDSPVWQAFGPEVVSAGTASVPIDGFVSAGDEFKYGIHGFQTTAYVLPTDQYGTQLDPPVHWNEFGATISDLPATIAVRPLVVINIAGKVLDNSTYAATVSDVEAWEARHGVRVPEGSVVFFRSDWSKGWQRYATEGVPAEFPGVTLAALKFLHLSRGILFHGHEPLDTDMTRPWKERLGLCTTTSHRRRVWRTWTRSPKLAAWCPSVFAKPLGGTGGYARFVAICPRGTTRGGLTLAEAPGAPLPTQLYPLRRNAEGVMVPTAGAATTHYCSVPASLGCRAVNEPVW